MDASRQQEAKVDSCGSEVRTLLVQLLLTPEQAASSLAIGRTVVYELMRSGALESVRIGTSRRVPADALQEYVDRLREKIGRLR